MLLSCFFLGAGLNLFLLLLLLLLQVNVFCTGTNKTTSLDPIDISWYIYIYIDWRLSSCFLFFDVTSTKDKGSAFAFCLGFRALKCIKHRYVQYFVIIFFPRITPQAEYCSLDWPINRGEKITVKLTRRKLQRWLVKIKDAGDRRFLSCISAMNLSFDRYLKGTFQIQNANSIIIEFINSRPLGNKNRCFYGADSYISYESSKSESD